MQNDIPSDIYQLIEQLPIISFDDNEEFQRLLSSDAFTRIFHYWISNYSNDKILTQSETIQKISLYLYLTNQSADFLEQTDQLLYSRPVPTIKEFLNNNFYMGYTSGTIYPYWREQMEKIFAPGSSIKKAVFAGCIGCLTGDTVVDTLSGEYTMKELVNNYQDKWVLSWNTQNKQWEPDKIIDAFSTGIKDIYEITLDNGEKIRCTSNHQFLSRNNKWVSIDNGLVEGLSMMPYYCDFNKKGYKTVKDNNDKCFIPRYQIVGRWKNWTKNSRVAIHHKNFNKLDDRPENLCLLPYKKHFEYHAKKGTEIIQKYNNSISGDEFFEYRSEIAKRSYQTYKQRDDFEKLEKKRKRGIKKLCQDSTHQKEASLSGWSGENGEKHRQQARELITNYNKSEKGRNISRKNAEYMRYLLNTKSEAEKQLISLKKGLSSLGRHKGKDSIEYKNKLIAIRKIEPYYDPDLTPKQRWKLKQNINHKIVSIKYIGKEEVFDLTTENNHNFALKSGIIAHNSGKSTIARKCMIYALYKVLCLKYPRAVFGVDNDASLASFIYSITLKNVFETNLMPFIKILESMPCFQRVQKISAFNNFDVAVPTQPIPFYIDNTNSTIHFKNNIMLVVGSQITHQTGRNIFNAFLDEVSEKGVEGGLEIINAIDSRISSRFQGSDYTFFSIVSSAKQKSSPVGEYIKSIPAYDKENIVFSPCLWEVKPDPSFQGDGRTFTVLVGNGVIPSRIIDNEEELKQIEDGTFVMQAGCEIINPPLTYRQKFEMSIDQAIQDIAGIATGGDDLVFKDTSSLEDPLLCPEIHFTADLGENTDLMKFLPSNMFETDITGKKRFKRAPFAERVCHFDLATSSGDSEAGIALLHKEYSVNPITGQNEEMYVFDFLGWVSSKIRIDLEAIQNLYAKLVTEYNCKLAYVTTDMHQGELMKQFFVNHNLSKKVGYLSVDRTIFPYDNAARLIELGRVKVGKCPYLLEQMQNVGVIKNKVDRLTKVRKDMLDSFVGSIEAAREINLTSGYKYYSETINKKNIDYNSLINTEEEILQII
jgi:hypothetical protein